MLLEVKLKRHTWSFHDVELRMGLQHKAEHIQPYGVRSSVIGTVKHVFLFRGVPCFTEYVCSEKSKTKVK